MEINTDKKRNFAIIAHSGAGKTSFAEAMLFDAGAASRLGRKVTGAFLGGLSGDANKSAWPLDREIEAGPVRQDAAAAAR